MPRGTDISSLLVIGAGLALYGCGDAETSRSEQVSFGGERPASVSECLERLAEGGEIWGEESVRASFVYDVSALGPDAVKQFAKRSIEGGRHSMAVHHGEASDQALKNFLDRTPEGDTEMFGTDDLVLLRVNDAMARPFDAALRTGCQRLREGVTIRQYTFSRGNF
ncbi:hypothetical protein Q9K01_06770 [Qipengyuania sp. DY56-A-20]|jgi:hypothetical protein|uniref:Lipoprotein n=1 Tax=Qipengyuania benthica TaxID=3067651 RepID=A0ABT9H7R8_9SPHN|nr:hypothetical protein [Qipengyuania sp. DY56-A-20]MDP4539321.1 hypothetical protein [Qipengyuania sp. DY56-A-20]